MQIPLALGEVKASAALWVREQCTRGHGKRRALCYAVSMKTFKLMSLLVGLLVGLMILAWVPAGPAQASGTNPDSEADLTFRDAVEAEQAGDLTAAFRHYQTLARAGDDRAQFNLGSFFINGELVNQDLVEGLAWIYLSVSGFADEDANPPWNRSFALEQLEQQVPEAQQVAAQDLARAWRQRFGTGQRTFDPELLSLPKLQVSTQTDCTAPTGSHLKRCRGESPDKDPFVTAIEANGARQPNDSAYIW